MGETVKIYDLAVKMIKLSGLSLRDENDPKGDIEIEFSGMRKGEKLHEELLIGNNVSTTQHDRIMMASEKFLPWDAILQKLGQLEELVEQGNPDEIRTILSTIVESYSSDPESFEDADQLQ
jgi:FlaA1/EpsC-like NDP-sugar epimerase